MFSLLLSGSFQKSPKTGEITRKPVPSKPRKTKGKRMKISSKNDDNEKVDIFKPSCGFCGSAGDSKVCVLVKNAVPYIVFC